VVSHNFKGYGTHKIIPNTISTIPAVVWELDKRMIEIMISNIPTEIRISNE